MKLIFLNNLLSYALRAFSLGVAKKCYFDTSKRLFFYFDTSFYNSVYITSSILQFYTLK